MSVGTYSIPRKTFALTGSARFVVARRQEELGVFALEPAVRRLPSAPRKPDTISHARQHVVERGVQRGDAGRVHIIGADGLGELDCANRLSGHVTGRR
jgi:hypothetical protein